MVDLNRNGAERLLADSLRREAAAERPEFSQSLHARLCAAVHRASAPSSPSCPSHPSHLSSLAFAAAIALAVVLAVISQRSEYPGPQDGATESRIAETNLPPAPPADSAVDLDQVTTLAGATIEGLGDLVDQAMASQQWGGLDEDARAVWEALAEELPADLSSALALSEPTASNP